MSRIETTARCRPGSSSIACSITARVSAASTRSSGHGSGGADQRACAGLAGGVEALRRHGRRVVVVVLERRERDAARLLDSLRHRAVGDDPQQPRLERGAALEALDPAQDGEPRLLHDLLGDRVRADVAARHAQHQAVVAPHELGERILVTGAKSVDQILIGGLRRHRDDVIRTDPTATAERSRGARSSGRWGAGRSRTCRPRRGRSAPRGCGRTGRRRAARAHRARGGS